MYRARDVMSTNVVLLRQEATVAEAVLSLVTHGISGAPVVDADGKLVGIVSELQLIETLYEPRFKTYPLQKIMTTNVTTVSEQTLLSDIGSLMVTQRIRRVPVVRGDRVVGIVARRDLLRYVAEAGDTLDRFLEEVMAVGSA